MIDDQLGLSDSFKILKDEHQKDLLLQFLLNFSLQKTDELEKKNYELTKQHKELTQVSMISSFVTNQLNEKVIELYQAKVDLENSLDDKTMELIKSEKFASIGEVSARLSHDIKNPLSVISNSSEIIAMNKSLSDPEKRSLARIEKAVERINHQLQNVLDYVKTSPLQKKKVSILTLLQTCIEDMNCPPNIKINIPKNDFKILCDETQIKTVFINLIHNSIQSLKDKGYINIRFYEKLDHYLLEFEDSGSGIPEDKLDEIFEPLFTTKQEGTGLGLVSCNTIIKQHGGQIYAKNNPTTFTIILPSK